MTVGATLIMGKVDPLALFDALAADLSARGLIAADRVAAARSLVPGRLPITALVDVGAPPDAVLRALATLSGAPPAPPRKEWKLEARAQLRVDELTWQRLLAVPIGFLDRRPLIAFADVIGLSSSTALAALPDHVPCVALEHDVRDALSRPVTAAKGGVSFLAPPSAVAQAMPGAAAAPAFSAGTAPALAGTMAGAAPLPSALPAPAFALSATPSSLPAPQAQPSYLAGAALSPQAVPSFAGLPSQTGAQGAQFSAPPMAGATSPPGGMPLSAVTPTPPPGITPSTASGSVIATMMATPLAPLPRYGTPGPLPAPTPHAGAAVAPSGTLLMGTGSVPLDAVRAPLETVSPGAPSFIGDVASASPATGQSPFGASFASSPDASGGASEGATVPASAARARADGGQGEVSRAPPPAHTAQFAAAQPVHVSVGPGVQCGRYVLEKKLGEGGMATVFVAHPVDGVGPPAAVKVVHEHLMRTSSGEELRKRFQREVSAMRQLQHVNIVACLEAGTFGDTEYLATELVSGGSLNRVLQRIGKLSPMLALSFFGDLLEGLAHAHEKGVVHRDLKPDNLLVDGDGVMKIADFGIARVSEGTQLTATGGIIGTPSYMSPEQALANPVDARTDLYSAGVILYELITGRNPFEGDSVAATLGNVLGGKVRPVGEVQPAVPFVVDLVISRSLSLRPDDRFQSARAMLAALRPALDRAREFRPLWTALVQKQAGTLANAFAKEADGHAARARKHQREGDRWKAALAAFRATSLVPDQREAKSVMSALNNAADAPPIRLARSSTQALAEREGVLERSQGDARLAEYRGIAQGYLDEHNPVIAAQYGRRAAAEYGVRPEEMALLARVLPDDELDEVRTLDARLGITPPTSAETMMRKAVWRPVPAAANAPTGNATVSLRAPGGADVGASGPADGARAGLPGYLKVAIVVASTAVPIGVAILALRGC